VGAASGALTGLLFVAVSVNAKAIATRPALRARAAQTLVLFASALLVSIVVAIPGQSGWVLGAELTALGCLTGIALAVVEPGESTETHDEWGRLNRLLDRVSPNTLTSVAIAFAGISKLVGVGGGLYWLVPAVMLALIGGVANTWLFLIRLSS
jgi:modulator of FtsH protease